MRMQSKLGLLMAMTLAHMSKVAMPVPEANRPDGEHPARRHYALYGGGFATTINIKHQSPSARIKARRAAKAAARRLTAKRKAQL